MTVFDDFINLAAPAVAPPPSTWSMNDGKSPKPPEPPLPDHPKDDDLTKEELDNQLDEALEDTFPASDPVSVTQKPQ
jgi:hypothetical protein